VSALSVLLAWMTAAGCSREETFPLKDGGIVRTWSTTYGTNHVAPGQFLPRLNNQLPKPLQRWLEACFRDAAAPIQEISTEEPCLLLWTHPCAQLTNSMALPIIRLNVVNRTDAAGILFYPHGSWGMANERTPGYAMLSCFPRRTRILEVGVEILETGMRDWPAPSTVLHLKNPHPYGGPSWDPESLPRSQTNSGIRATLYDLGVTNRMVTNRLGRRLAQVQTWLRFEALDSAQHPLKVLNYELSDPGGNRLFVPIQKVLEKTATHSFLMALFEDEPAWRLEVETERAEGDPTVEVERVEFPGLSDPPDNDETGTQSSPMPPVKMSRAIPTLELGLYQFAAGRSPKVQLALRGCPRGVRVALERAMDESGRIWNVRETGSAGTPGSDRFRDYAMSLPGTPGASAKSMTLTLRIHRTALFEFFPPARFSAAVAQ
jgi:hypothetical protein